MTPSLTQEHIGPVGVLRLNRPPANTLSLDFLKALRAEIEEAAQNPSLRCLVITSALKKYFSAGMDLEDILPRPKIEQEQAFFDLFGLYMDLVRFPKPTLIAINGAALLGGWIIAMGCDFRLIAPRGKIALSEIRLGITPTTMLIEALARMTKNQVLVKEMILMGKTVGAEEALASGLVERIVPAESLMEESLRQAGRLSELPSCAYASIKKSYRTAPGGDPEQFLQASAREFLEIFHGPEAREGLAAMREKRRPKYHGN
ncbi:MAG: enoyl-CoA hydratase/isomerase family protein [Elusimicrobiota bacterium]